MSNQPETRYQRIAREQRERQAAQAERDKGRLRKQAKAAADKVRRQAKRAKPSAEGSDHDYSMNG